MEKVWMLPQQPHHRLTIIFVNGVLQQPCHGVPVDPLLQLRPGGKPVLTCHDQLRVIQEKSSREMATKSASRNFGCRRRIRSSASGTPDRHAVSNSRASRFGTSRWGLSGSLRSTVAITFLPQLRSLVRQCEQESQVLLVFKRPVGLAHFRGQDASGEQGNTSKGRFLRQARNSKTWIG